jgi:hypothetical protein
VRREHARRARAAQHGDVGAERGQAIDDLIDQGKPI